MSRGGRGEAVRRGPTQGRRWLVAVGAVAAVALAACDAELSGPGAVDARVLGSAGQVGGVVLDVTWPGAEGFEGRGATQVYWSPIQGVPDRHRVIIVGPPGEELLFTVDLAYLSTDPPIVTVVEATDGASEPIPAADVRVRLDG